MKSSTAAGATSLRGGTWATSSPSRPVTQCTGASKWVPVCSPVEMSFQYQPGPRSSYRLISSSRNGRVFPNGSGSSRIGVLSCSGAVRSITSTRPSDTAASKSVSTAIGLSSGQVGGSASAAPRGRHRVCRVPPPVRISSRRGRGPSVRPSCGRRLPARNGAGQAAPGPA